MIRKTLFTIILLLFGLSTFAQTLTVTKEFTLVPNSSVLAMYKNQFGKWEKPDMDDTFPYAVIRVALDGEAKDVSMAKKKLGLYLGTQRMVVDVYTDNVNEILFLIPSGAGHVQLQCGDGCTPYTIIDLPRLRSNMVYSGRVHFVPAEGSEVVEVVDVEKLKQELFAEFLSMQQQQLQQQQNTSVTPDSVEEKIHMEPKEKEPKKEREVKIIPVDSMNNYQRYAFNAKIKTLVMGQIGYSVAPQLSYGAMIGQMYKGYGWYVSGRSNFSFDAPTIIASCDEDGMIDGVKPFFSGNTQTTHFAVHGGFMMNFLEKVTKNKFTTLGAYVGGGYGKRQLVAETANGEWIKYAPTSHNGFAANVGLFGSVAGVTLNVGVSTINFKYMDFELGVGFMF